MFIDYRNVHEMLTETVGKRPEKVAYRYFDPAGEPVPVTWAEFREQVGRAARSLMALGVEKGDKVTIVSYTQYRWVLTDLAVNAVGACTVGIYQSNLAKDCRYIIDHSDSVLVFAEDAVQVEKLLSIREEIPRVRKVILLGGRPEPSAAGDDWITTYEAFLALGDDVAEDALARRIDAVGPNDPAGIIYTSGTTGRPKGVILTHDNLTFTAQSVKGCGGVEPDSESLLFLPLAHVFARTAVYTALHVGCTTAFARGLDNLPADFQSIRPHWFISVPRIFEKVHARVVAGAEAKGGAALKLFHWACRVGDRVSDLKLSRETVPPLLSLQYALASKLVFSKIRAALGGRVAWCISGAAPLNPRIGKFFHGAGVLILEGLGMTENTSFSNLNRLENHRFGWVGPPGPGIEQKIAEDGEILFSGRNVMAGYYKMAEETAETFTPDGWLKSGDLGEIDAENFLRITGRKKELIVTAGGKNIAPAAIEGVLATSKYLNQVCVLGDGRRFLTAVVSLDMENAAAYARASGIPFEDPAELVEHPEVIALAEAEVAEKNREFPSYETIKKVAVVPEFTIDDGLMTPTMKLRKSAIEGRYRDRIEAMYR